MNKGRFEGRIAIVTGGGTGIGQATALQLAAEGAKVVVMGRRLEKLKETVELAEKAGTPVVPMAGDVAVEADCIKVIEETVKKFGTVDLLVNAAGIGGPSDRMEECTMESVRNVFDINYFGSYMMVKYSLPYMQKQNRGSIVNIASIDGMMGYDCESPYAATKAAVISMAKTVATENGANGVRINAIAPVWIDTPMLDVAIENYKKAGVEVTKETLRNGSMKRPGLPSEIAEGACWLLSDEASYVNGHTLVIDGAKTLS